MGLWRSIALLAFVLPLKAGAEAYACGDIQIHSDPTQAEQICRDAEAAIDDLASCSLTVKTPLKIEVVENLGEACLGIYRCGDHQIDILSPEHYAQLQPDGIFASVSPKAFAASVLRHELVHAALSDMPCPFKDCVVGQEYLAYAMQIMFLPPADLDAFNAETPFDTDVKRDELNRLILLMAPEVFARKAWLHLSARRDPCRFAGQVARAEVLLDYELPF